jgi:predicted transcriptional regulator
MITEEMKKQLIDKINSTTDENTLEEIYRILEAGDIEVDMVILSEDQKTLIDQGLKDIEEGRVLSNEEANRQIDEWLKK